MPQPMTSGEIHSVPCPHCGHQLDFRELNTAEGTTLFTGAEISCEKCNMMSHVAQVRRTTLVALKPMNKQAQVEPPVGAGVPPQRRQLPPAGRPAPRGFFNKLLGK